MQATTASPLWANLERPGPNHLTNSMPGKLPLRTWSADQGHLAKAHQRTSSFDAGSG
jgi:hypothetical protein